MEETKLSNFESYLDYFNAVAVFDKVYFTQVLVNEEYDMELKLNTFDLKTKELKVEKIENTTDEPISGIKLVIPQSAPIEIPKMYAHVFFNESLPSLRSLKNDEGKLTIMGKSFVDVPPEESILYFDGSN